MTSKKQTRPQPKKTPARRRALPPRSLQSFETMVRATIAKVTLVPDVTEFRDITEDAALVEAYIDQYCVDECKEALRAHAKTAGDDDVTHVDIVWIREEIAYALGVEVGRRLRGDDAFDGGAK